MRAVERVISDAKPSSFKGKRADFIGSDFRQMDHITLLWIMSLSETTRLIQKVILNRLGSCGTAVYWGMCTEGRKVAIKFYGWSGLV